MFKRCPFCGSEMARTSNPTPFDVIEVMIEDRIHYECPNCGFVASFKSLGEEAEMIRID